MSILSGYTSGTEKKLTAETKSVTFLGYWGVSVATPTYFDGFLNLNFYFIRNTLLVSPAQDTCIVLSTKLWGKKK